MQNKKLIITISAILALTLSVIFWWWRAHHAPTNQPSANQSATAQIEIRAERHAQLQRAVEATRAVDKDFDGLTDAEEINTYRTDPSKPDTDADGLLDKDETFIYKTNPLKYDTYGLGHSDGWGVRHRIILPNGKVKNSP